jgi:hypothetical protein
MGFVRIPGLKGKVFVPEKCPAKLKKHACPDCFGCQRCSDDRCNLCRAPGLGRPEKAGPRRCAREATDGSDRGQPEEGGGGHG